MHSPIAKEGFFFIIPFVAAFVLLLIFSRNYVALVIIFLITFFLVFFFRDPVRIAPEGENLIIAPADGKIIKLEKIYENRYLKENVTKISIFMSLFNVHVNRVPVTGTVEKINYNKGKFISAFKDKASLDNEQNSIIIDTGRRKIVVKQIAGIIARRIICRISEKQKVRAGEKLGLICFGSRADIFIPGEVEMKIRLGETVKAGKTIIGVLK